MATPNEKLAASLGALRELQKAGRRVFQTSELTRTDRERLIRNGFLREVMKGWLISASPSAREEDSTPWYASFWEFCARYCAARFGNDWHLGPEQSLLLHAENTIIPSQAVIASPRGTNNKVSLPFGTSLYDLKESQMPPDADLIERDGLRLFSAAAALVRASETLYSRSSVEMRVVLAGIDDTSDVLRHLLAGGHSVIAGRLAGAFRRIGKVAIADEIVSTMKSAGYDVREYDPFTPEQIVAPLPPVAAPIVGRMQVIWADMREKVIEVFPVAPGLPQDLQEYMQFVEDIYRSDAYHSLSIEGYNVSPALIERVRAGGWDPDHDRDDRQNRDALAARGYWQAFQAVKDDVAEIIASANAAELVSTNHRLWYRQLFQPCVAAGLMPAGALAGYRNDAVYLRTSRYVPPRWEAVRQAMPALFELLGGEEDPGVRAVLGHWMFGYIHLYPDGNGRMARFLMNAMLASGGFPWTVIRVDDRAAYLSALDSASIDLDIVPFAEFIAERARRSMQQAAT